MATQKQLPHIESALKEGIVREPLHRQINLILKKEIAAYRVGQRIPSEHNLALRFGVSIMTVRQALSGLINEGLLVARRGSGTFVARQQTLRRVAVLVEQRLESAGISHFYFQLVRHLHLLCHEQGYECSLYIGDTPPGLGTPDATVQQRLLADIQNGQIHGILALATSSDISWLKRVDNAGLPVVGGYHQDLRYCVRLHKEEMLAQAVAWLATHGRKRLGLLSIGNEECEFFQTALGKYKLGFEPQWAIACPSPREDAAVGYEGFLRLWHAKAGRPDGLIIMDDVLCSEALPAIVDQGIRAPEDIMIVTHANKGIAWPVKVPMARMEVDPRLWAEAMLETLKQLWEDRTMVSSVRYVPFTWRDEISKQSATAKPRSPAKAKMPPPAIMFPSV